MRTLQCLWPCHRNRPRSSSANAAALRSPMQGGGMSFGNGSTVVIRDSLCDYNMAGGDGAGLYIGSTGILALESVSFHGNSARGSAGAFAVGAGTNATAVGCDFSANAAGSAGGALSLFGSAALSLSDSSFIANDAFTGGLLAFSDSVAAESAVSFKNLTVSGNTATAGSLYALFEGSSVFRVRDQVVWLSQSSSSQIMPVHRSTRRRLLIPTSAHATVGLTAVPTLPYSSLLRCQLAPIAALESRRLSATGLRLQLRLSPTRRISQPVATRCTPGTRSSLAYVRSVPSSQRTLYVVGCQTAAASP